MTKTKYRGQIRAVDLRMWRIRHNFTQAKAAEELQMPVDTYKDYEKSKRPIPGVVGVAIRGITETSI